jgi:hypothetical protein
MSSHSILTVYIVRLRIRRYYKEGDKMYKKILTPLEGSKTAEGMLLNVKALAYSMI